MKKKILVITQCVPFPLDTGGNQAVFNGIEAIRNDFDIIVTCYNPYNIQTIDQLKEVWPDVRIIPFIYNKWKQSKSFLLDKLVERICNKLEPDGIYNYSSAMITNRFNHYVPEFYEFLNKLICEEQVDFVQCEFMCNLPLVHCLPQTVKKVFVHHELEFCRNEQLFCAKGYNDAYSRYVLNMLKQDEIASLSLFDGVITLSDVDAKKLYDEGVTSKIFPSFALVKPCNKFYEIEDVFNKRISFVGPESHLPNKNGVRWFLDNVWSLIQSESTDWTFEIIGKWSEDTRSEYCKKYSGVKFLGFVDDLGEALKGTIMIVPLLIGSGIRMKLLEASNMGIPFVSTTIGAEGLPFKHNESCMIANTPKDFAHCILAMQDPKIQQKMAMNAKKNVSKTFSLEQLRKNRLDAFAHL